MKYILVIMFLVGCTFARKLPSFIEVCKPKHTDVSKCIAKNVDNLRTRLAQKEGIVEMAIPSINPLVIPLADIKLGDFRAKLEDVKLWKVDQYQIENLEMELGDKIRLELKIKFPRIEGLAQYTVNGQLLVLKLDGSGPFQINVTDLLANAVALGNKVTREGKEYIVLNSIEIKPEVGHLDLLLENLFPNNPELTDNANKILNENQNVIVEEFAPLVVNIIKEFLLSVTTNIFDHYSYDILFPDD